MPAGFPNSIVSSTTWSGVDFDNDTDRKRYTLSLNEAQILELEQACSKFNGMLLWKPLGKLRHPQFYCNERVLIVWARMLT